MKVTFKKNVTLSVTPEARGVLDYIRTRPVIFEAGQVIEGTVDGGAEFDVEQDLNKQKAFQGGVEFNLVLTKTVSVYPQAFKGIVYGIRIDREQVEA